MKDVVRKSKDAKEECLRILEKFQIQVDSPIVILQQDEAKEMLKVESADKLYKFFEKATLIRQCFDQYSAAQVRASKKSHFPSCTFNVFCRLSTTRHMTP